MALTYDEAQAKALQFHPAATAQLIDHEWHIVVDINTGEMESHELPEALVGTPAEEAWNTLEGNYGWELDRWAYKNGYSDWPLLAVGLQYNLENDIRNASVWSAEVSAQFKVRRDEIDKLVYGEE